MNAFIEFGDLPESSKERTWLTDYILVRAGYKKDLESMSTEEYDFVKIIANYDYLKEKKRTEMKSVTGI